MAAEAPQVDNRPLRINPKDVLRAGVVTTKVALGVAGVSLIVSGSIDLANAADLENGSVIETLKEDNRLMEHRITDEQHLLSRSRLPELDEQQIRRIALLSQNKQIIEEELDTEKARIQPEVDDLQLKGGLKFFGGASALVILLSTSRRIRSAFWQ